MQATSCQPEQIAFIGDEYVDEMCMLAVGLSMTVPNAMEEIKAISKWVSSKPGGQGAVREAIQFILKNQNKLENIFK